MKFFTSVSIALTLFLGSPIAHAQYLIDAGQPGGTSNYNNYNYNNYDYRNDRYNNYGFNGSYNNNNYGNYNNPYYYQNNRRGNGYFGGGYTYAPRLNTTYPVGSNSYYDQRYSPDGRFFGGRSTTSYPTGYPSGVSTGRFGNTLVSYGSRHFRVTPYIPNFAPDTGLLFDQGFGRNYYN